MVANLSVVGTRAPKVDGVEKVTGAARYAGDVNLPGMLYGKIKRSPHAHANVVSIDSSKALALEPSLMLLDEVVAGLNPTEADKTIDLILKIKDRGISILIVEHISFAGEAGVTTTELRISVKLSTYVAYASQAQLDEILGRSASGEDR